MTSRLRRDQRGFTLIELMLSLMLFTVGILSLGATSSIVVRTMGGAREQTLAATMAQSRFEQLRAFGCTTSGLAGGSASTRGIAEKWTVTTPSSANNAARYRLLTDSVTYRTSRGSTVKVYNSQRLCP